MNRFKMGRTIMIVLPMIFVSNILIGQIKPSIRSIYKYSSKNYSLNVPDSILKKMPLNNSIEVSLGNVFYTNIYSDNISRTDITFKEDAGIQFNEEIKPTYFVNDIKNKLYILFEDSVIIKKTKYFMPELIRTDQIDTINGYISRLYTYQNANNILFNIWISDKLSCYVSPGFYFTNYGGVTKIDFKYGEMLWSLDLDKFEKLNELPTTTKQHNYRIESSQKEIFPFFNVK